MHDVKGQAIRGRQSEPYMGNGTCLLKPQSLTLVTEFSKKATPPNTSQTVPPT